VSLEIDRAAPAVAAQRLAARVAQPAWAATALARRAAVIEAAARELAGDARATVETVAAASGRPGAAVWSAELIPTLDALRWLARAGSRALAPHPLRRSPLQWYFRATRHTLHWEPHGVIGVVTPGNSVLFLALPQVAAALLAGNAVLWKPAAAGAALALRSAAALRRGGLPPALLQIVIGGAQEAREIVEASVDKLVFIGGSSAGLELYQAQAARGRPAVLELSGRHVAVVLAGADLHLAARGIAWGKLDNRGRNCVSVQLVLVQRAVAATFLECMRRALDEAGSAMVGTDPAQARRLAGLAADALERGARPVAGIGPAVLLADVARGMRVVEEEIQGPLLAVASVDSAADAVAWINSGHRLSASIWSGDPASARRLARTLDVGQVWINDQLHPVAQPEVTLAGRGSSGFGAARGLAGLMEMVQPKVISETPLGSPRRHYAAAAEAESLFRATVEVGFARGPLRRAGAALRLLHAVVRLARTPRRG
jgi:acyl-CoA reductase-like NAD-dependent aldehyde dehydrogenase